MKITNSLVLTIGLSLASSVSSPKTPEQIYSENAPSIVVVYAIQKDSKDSKQGTGVVISRGTVVTNCHVAISSSIEIGIRHRNRNYPARVTIEDRPRDLCILSV